MSRMYHKYMLRYSILGAEDSTADKFKRLNMPQTGHETLATSFDCQEY